MDHKPCKQDEQRCMNLYAAQGDKVRYIAPRHDQNDYFSAGENAEEMLVEGRSYTVRETHDYEPLTFVELEEHPGVLFYTTDFVDC